MATSPEQEEVVTLFRDVALSQRIRLSKQPWNPLRDSLLPTGDPSEIEEIRGVRCERVLDTLLKHGLIRVAGRKKGFGKPPLL
jgi:segregation and condensation protein B